MYKKLYKLKTFKQNLLLCVIDNIKMKGYYVGQSKLSRKYTHFSLIAF